MKQITDEQLNMMYQYGKNGDWYAAGQLSASLPELPATSTEEAETCSVELGWKCCNVTGHGLYPYLSTACDGNASDRDEWKFCPVCGKPIKPGRE